MAVEKWVAGSGAGLTWTNAFTGTTLNAIASTNAILSDLQIDNTTALDVFADVSIALASIVSGAGAPYIGIYLVPFNSDLSTYGDGRFASSAAGPPASQYFAGAIPLIPSVTQAQEGLLRGIILPPAKFKFILHNMAGVALAATTNTCKYITYNRSVA